MLFFSRAASSRVFRFLRTRRLEVESLASLPASADLPAAIHFTVFVSAASSGNKFDNECCALAEHRK